MDLPPLSTSPHFKKVLDHPRQELWKDLHFLNDYQFYLAGGTALALQMGHRTSADFDFYTATVFDPMALWARFHREIPDAAQIRTAEGTLILSVKSEIELSFFFYDYPMLEPLVSLPPLSLASLRDIAAMKIVAIEQRGIRRDFVDLYFLSKQLGLFPIISATLEKYPGHNVYPIFQALCYFQDADEEPDRPLQPFKPLPWEEVKGFFLREVKNVQKLF